MNISVNKHTPAVASTAWEAIRATAVILASTCIAGTAQAEGSNEIGTNQALQASTLILVDILDLSETFVWTGSGTASVTPPGEGATVFNSGQIVSPSVLGTYEVQLSQNQAAWDITVTADGGGTLPGRVSSTAWVLDGGSFDPQDAINSSFSHWCPLEGLASIPSLSYK